MNGNGEERTDILVLIDEEGNEHDFALVDRFQVNKRDYAILVPVLYIETEEEGEEIDFEEDAFIFRVEGEEGEETLIEVDNEAEWNEVASIWEERVQNLDLKDEEDFY